PGVISARIVAGDSGMIDEVHLLTSQEGPAKQTVRNVESARIGHLGLRIDHRQVSVAAASGAVGRVAAVAGGGGRGRDTESSAPAASAEPGAASVEPEASDAAGRRVYFEDVEVRRSRQSGVTCRGTVRRGEASRVGDADGLDRGRKCR